MRRKGVISLFLCGLLMLAFTGCGNVNGNSIYRVTNSSLYKEEFAVGFRKDDRLAQYVEAAMKTLIADGVAGELSRKWIGDDELTLRGDSSALEDLIEEQGELEKGTLIMGLDPGSAPMSFKGENGEYQGFDVDFASRVCGLLGLELIFQPISGESILAELNSGNVDCVWGAMSFAHIGEQITATASYMSNRKVLITLKEDRVYSTKQLDEAVIATTFDPVSYTAMEESSDLKKSIASIKKLNSADECIEQLKGRQVDAIVIDEVTALTITD